MNSKTLGKVITWTFPAISLLCLLGALVLVCVQPTPANVVLVSGCSVGLSFTTWLASDDSEDGDDEADLDLE